jgi:hypothetical protein
MLAKKEGMKGYLESAKFWVKYQAILSRNHVLEHQDQDVQHAKSTFVRQVIVLRGIMRIEHRNIE